MENEDLIATAKRLIIADRTPIVMATVSPTGRPRIRWMGGIIMEEPFTLYMATGYKSRKVDDIVENINCELMISAPDYSQTITMTGVAMIEKSSERKRKLWSRFPRAERYFSGPDDPNYGVIRVDVQEVELISSATQLEPYVTRV